MLGSEVATLPEGERVVHDGAEELFQVETIMVGGYILHFFYTLHVCGLEVYT